MKNSSRRKAKLICFTGIDGSGKTTLAKELVKAMNEKEIQCKYVYAKLDSFILKPFILFGEWMFLRGKDAFKNYSQYSDTKRKAIKRHFFLSSFYQRILLFDYSLQLFFKVKLPLIFSKSIVCDRYIYDTVITNLSVDMDYSKDRIVKLINNLLRLFPEPDITFLIDIPEEIAYQRKNDTPSIIYLKERRTIYLDIGKEYEMVILDGSKSLDKLTSIIQKKVFKEVRI